MLGFVLFLSLTFYDLIIYNIHAPTIDKLLVALLLVCFQVSPVHHSNFYEKRSKPGEIDGISFSWLFSSTNEFFSLQICMVLSSIYHTFSCRSEKDYWFFLSYDLFGVALSLLAIYLSGVYYAFWCHRVCINNIIV